MNKFIIYIYNKIYKILFIEVDMKKGLLIIVGVFTFIFFLNSFVSAEGYCLGNYISCNNLKGDTCGTVGGCTWYNYGPTPCSTSDDCVAYCSNGKCGCYNDQMCHSGEFCNTTSDVCESGSCSGTGRCSTFDRNQFGCEQYPSYCTWQPGCLVNTDCNSGYYCTGTQYCTGTHLIEFSWDSPALNPVSSDNHQRYAHVSAPFDWTQDIEYYPECNYHTPSGDNWDCGGCSDCGDARSNNVAYVVKDTGDGNGLSWHRRDCVWTNVLGVCFNPRWAGGEEYIGPALKAGGYPCNSLYVGSCSPSPSCQCSSNVGCSVYKRYGTCELSCVTETDSAFCTRLGKTCGSVTALDNCGTSRTVTCGPPGISCGLLVWGTCTFASNKLCVNGVYGSCSTATDPRIANCAGKSCGDDGCGGSCTPGCSTGYTCNSLTGQCLLNCNPETDTAFCTRIGIACGSATANDNCGTSRTVNCGGCDDSNACTTDGCSSGTCIHTPVVCSDDNNACTSNIGCVGGTCQYIPINCNDLNACTTDSCSALSGCSHTTINSCINNDGCCPSQCNIGNDNDCAIRCGDGIKSTGEQCDGSDLSGASTCASHYSSEPGWTGTPTCNLDCTLNYNSPPCIVPPVCTVTSATWNTAEIMEGKSVKLNIQTEHCDNGQAVSFVIKEDNHGAIFNPDRTSKNTPANAFITSNSTTGTWAAEWIDDSVGSETNPPEYYFTATIVGSSPPRSLRSTTPHPELNVTQTLDVVCAGVNYCSNYLTQSNCEKDLCTVGKDEVPSSVTCGGRFNSNTGCFDNTDCGCSWVSGVCKPSWTTESSCGTCGNSIRDFGEECDDGNLINGDGCNATCYFDSYVDPCPIGLTLCSDGTCSLNCEVTDTTVAPCDYDHSCETGEGCTCSDCNGYPDTCEVDLTCNIFDKACCNPSSDGICSPYCAYVDPDCLTGTCGNGVEEKGEECDLGSRNSNIIESGCNSDCTLQDNIVPGLDGCPEGTNLCIDGTCSLNCFATDSGIGGCDIPGTCAQGLVCSAEDQACCNEGVDGFCDEYCAFVDPDCVSISGEGNYVVGTCSYTEIGTDTCEDDHMLTRHLAHSWEWALDNLLHFDPLGKELQCVDIEDTLVCPASVEVPFFGIYEFAIAVVVIGLIYLIYELRKKNDSKKKRK